VSCRIRRITHRLALAEGGFFCKSFLVCCTERRGFKVTIAPFPFFLVFFSFYMQEAVTTRREINKKRTKSTNAENENTKRGLAIAAGQRKYLFKVLWGEEERERNRREAVQ
jgi:hypothetical protein